MKKVSIGRIVTYRDPANDEDYAAVVSGIAKGRFEPVHLTVFDPSCKHGTRRLQSVPRNMGSEGDSHSNVYPEPVAKRSWRWPERVE